MALELGKCRLCLKLGDFYSIFTVDNGVQLAEMVMECSRVKIYEGDGLPEKVCSECIQKLSSAYIFKQQCERADQDLRRNYVPPPGFGLSPNRQSSDSAFSTHTEYSNVNKSISTEGKVTPASSDRKRRTESNNTNDDRHDYHTDIKRDMRESLSRPTRLSKKPKYLNNSMDSDDDNAGSLTAESVCTESNEPTKSEFKCTKCQKQFNNVYGLNNHLRTHRLDRLEGTVTSASTPRGRSIESDNASSSSRQDYPSSTKRVTELRRLGKAKRNIKNSSIDSDDDDNGDSSFKSETAGTDSDDSTPKSMYKCKLCPNEYTGYRALNSHMRFHKRESLKEETPEISIPIAPEVPDDDNLSCVKCGKTYKLKIMLKRHQQLCKQTPQKQSTPNKQPTPQKQQAPTKQQALQKQQPPQKQQVAKQQTPLKQTPLKLETPPGSPKKELLVCLEPVDGKHNVKVECDICTAKFKTLDNLNKHLRVVHAAAPKRSLTRAAGSVSVTCIYCRESFDDYYVHNAHFSTCSKKDTRETFKCPLCLVVSFKKVAYFAHIKNTHFEPETRQVDPKEEELKCRFCNKVLASQQLLVTHLAAHMSNIDESASEDTRTVPNTSTPETSKSTSNCTHCNKEFKYKRSLINHELSCSMRDKETVKKDDDVENEAESSQDDEADDNTCDICEKQFSYKALLLHHKRTKHTMCAGVKRASITLKNCPVKCMICDIDMQVKDIHAHNKEHISMNMKPRNIYTCGACGESFKNLSALATHIKFVHRLNKETPNERKYRSIDPAAFCEVVVAKTEPQEWPQGVDFSSVPDGVVKIEGQPDAEPTAFVCPTCGKKMPSANSLRCHMACHVRYAAGDGRKFECFVCKEAFRFQVHYKMHMRIHYNDTNLDPKLLTCSICSRKSKNLRAARAHMAFHNQTRFQNKDYQCSLCKRVFQNRKVYLYHMAIHQKRGDSTQSVTGLGLGKDIDKSMFDGTNTCELCGKVCDSEVSLKHHIIWHKSKGSLYSARHECTICNMQFTNKRTLTLHVRTHYENDNGPYKCHLCEKGFTDEDYYRRHVKSHNFDHSSHKKRIERLRKDQVKCPICSRYYPDLVKLIRHLKRTHPESKMIKADPDAPPQRYYPCQLCAKVFIDERRLQFHKEAHLRKPVFYKCKFCGRNAMSLKAHNIHIKAHLAAKHIDEPLKCPHCTETFVKGYGLHHHLRDVHGINETWIAERTNQGLDGPLKDLQCSVCHKILASKGNFQRHIDYHNSLRCNYCFEYFSTHRFLEGHLSFMCEKKKLVGDTEVFPKRVKCHICYKAFHLQVKLDCHLRTQHGISVTKEASAGKKEIVCDYCFKVFENEYALTTHKIYHRTIGYYGCRYCSKKFGTLTLYRRHKTSHLYGLNVDNPTKCDHCDERFVAFRDMITHMKDEHGDDSEWIIMPKDSIEETCGICNKTFFNLHKHLSYHEENKCKKCGEYFYSVIDFDNHLCAIESDDDENGDCINGNGSKYEECNFCFKPITTTNSKLKHDKIHRGSGSISCRFCSLKFKTIDAFNIHAFTHRSSKYNKRPIRCRQCGEKFVKYGPFIKHMRSVHKSALKIHYRATVKPERCVVCGDDFPNLHNHYRAHLLNQCQQCRKYFTSYKLFTMHECDKEDGDPSKVFACDQDLVALINAYVPKDEKNGEKLYGDSGDEDDDTRVVNNDVSTANNGDAKEYNGEADENEANDDTEEFSQDEEPDVKNFGTFQSPVISDVLSLYKKEEVASQGSENNSQMGDKDVFVISSDDESLDVENQGSPIVVVDD